MIGKLLPDRALCLPTFSHLLIVNKLSLSIYLSLARSLARSRSLSLSLSLLSLSRTRARSLSVGHSNECPFYVRNKPPSTLFLSPSLSLGMFDRPHAGEACLQAISFTDSTSSNIFFFNERSIVIPRARNPSLCYSPPPPAVTL